MCSKYYENQLLLLQIKNKCHCRKYLLDDKQKKINKKEIGPSFDFLI